MIEDKDPLILREVSELRDLILFALSGAVRNLLVLARNGPFDAIIDEVCENTIIDNNSYRLEVGMSISVKIIA